jgi:hypothetical protein
VDEKKYFEHPGLKANLSQDKKFLTLYKAESNIKSKQEIQVRRTDQYNER